MAKRLTHEEFKLKLEQENPTVVDRSVAPKKQWFVEVKSKI